MKKIMVLGGSATQVSVIQKSKQLGYYTITCDYLPENPGHKFADKYYNESTVDYNKVLEIAIRENIDAISSYASDPGAYTAAFVSEKMGLVGSGTKAVNILSNKNEFRKFLKSNNFNTPFYKIGTQYADFKDIELFPGILKPIDSSGSKGVVIIKNKADLKNYIDYSKSFSRSGKIIFEEFIERDGPQLHGEAFVVDGKIVVFELGDQYFSPISPLVPYSTILPTSHNTNDLLLIKNQLQRVVDLLDFKTGGMNIEVIKSKNGKIYFIEIGSRSGGNFMPELIEFATGVDLVKLNITSLLENKTDIVKNETKPTAQIIFHSFGNGNFSYLDCPEFLKEGELYLNMFKHKNDKIEKYKNSKDVVGVGIYSIKNKDLFEQALQNYKFVQYDN
jgi:biotin carboxylase